MKRSIHFLATVALICSGAIASAQQPPKPTMPAQRDPFLRERGAPVTAPRAADHVSTITGIMETYVLKAADAVSLLSSAPDGAVRYRQVRQWVAGGRARLETIAAGAAKSNTRALVESVDMVQLPSKFLPPQGPQDPPIAAGFTQQGIGDRFEFQPLIAPDGAAFNLNITAASSQLLEHRALRVAPRMAPTPATRIQRSEIITSLLGRSGVPLLLGTLTRPVSGENGEKEITVAFGRVVIDRAVPDPRPELRGSLDYAEHLFSFYSVDRAAAVDLLGGELKAGAVFAAVQALVEKKEARFEHAALVASQAGVRAKSDENVVLAETTGMAADPQTKQIYTPALAGKNMGLSIEVESGFGPPDAQLRGTPIMADVSAIINWREDRGVWKPSNEAIALHPESTAQESRKIETSFLCYAGVQTFIGTLNPPRVTGVNERKDSGRVWLAFMRATPVQP